MILLRNNIVSAGKKTSSILNQLFTSDNLGSVYFMKKKYAIGIFVFESYMYVA